MLRTLFSAVTVLLLCVIAYLWFTNRGKTEVAKAPEPAVPVPLAPIKPALPVLPLIPPTPATPVPVPVTPTTPSTAPRIETATPIPTTRRTTLPLRRKLAETKNKRTHVVEAGDTLWGISSSYFGSGDYVSKIMELNGLRSQTLRRGQVIYLPDEPNVEEHAAAVTDTQDFEPQPPTLSTVKKLNP